MVLLILVVRVLTHYLLLFYFSVVSNEWVILVVGLCESRIFGVVYLETIPSRDSGGIMLN